MPIAADIKKIAEDIEISHAERVAFLTDLFKGTDETLKTFGQQHQKMATNLWDFLTSNRETREKLVNSLRSKNKKELSAMVEKLTNFLKESQQTLKQETNALMSYIKDNLSLLEKELSDFLSDFRSQHKTMASEMRKELTSDTEKRIEEVRKTLSTFAHEHQARSNKLRQDLSDSQKKLEKTVKEMRAEVKSDLKQAKQNWQNLAKIMATKRAGKVVKKVEKVPQREVMAAAKAFTGGELKDQAMRLIAGNPGGISLSQMGKTLKIPYVRLARPVSQLVRDGRVKKENSQYFPG